MYASSNLIQSKRVFRLQMFTHSVSKASLVLNTQISKSLISCHANISRTLTSYDEHAGLLDQIGAYEKLALHIARFTALVEQLPSSLNIFPGIDPIVSFSEELFFDLQHVSAQKRNHLNMLTSFLPAENDRVIKPGNDHKQGSNKEQNNNNDLN